MATLAAILTAESPSDRAMAEETAPKPSTMETLRSSIQSKMDLAAMPPVYKIPLWDLNCQFGMVKRKSTQPILLKDAIKIERRKQKANVTVFFAIRQPG